MGEKQRQKIISELKDFYKKLKSYNRYVCSEEQLSQVQIRYRDSLREKLVRQSGALKGKIIDLTGTQYAEGPLTGRFDIWAEAFNTTAMSADRTALAFCINATNEAIGKLESDILKGKRDEQGNLIKIEKIPSSSTEPPKAFIAHGGDSPALRNLKSFLEALGVQPLVVEEQPSEGRSVSENVDWYARQADCAIILATKGDIDGKTGSFIPRGNVLMEIGKLQQIFKDRIIYLLQAGTKFPTNIGEKVRERFTTQSMDKAFIKIAKELKKFGILKAVKP